MLVYDDKLFGVIDIDWIEWNEFNFATLINAVLFHMELSTKFGLSIGEYFCKKDRGKGICILLSNLLCWFYWERGIHFFDKIISKKNITSGQNCIFDIL